MATSRQEALQRLIASGQHPLELRVQVEKKEGKSGGFRLGRRALRLATLTRQLATLAEAGVPIVKSLDVLIEQQRDQRGRKILVDVREGIQGGSTFADALGQHPDVFPPLMKSMVSVGERSGTLDQQLLELSDLYDREEALRGEVLAAVSYPLLVFLFGAISTIILVVFFIPQLEVMFEDSGQDLPGTTRLLLAISHGLTENRGFLVGALIVCAVGLKMALRSPDVRMAMDRWKLRIPILGTLLRNLAIARLSRLLGTLAHGGISIVDALEIVKPAVGNEAIAASVGDISTRIRTGESLAALMKEKEVFPPLAVQMVAVGEETGLLDKMLLRIADAYDRETMVSTKVMTSILAPMLILCVAVVVGFIVISMLLPIFGISSVMR